MQYLRRFVSQKNHLNRLKGFPEYDADVLKNAEAQELFKFLEEDLSPGNFLAWNMSKQEIQGQYAMLTGALSDLRKLGFVQEKRMNVLDNY